MRHTVKSFKRIITWVSKSNKIAYFDMFFDSNKWEYTITINPF